MKYGKLYVFLMLWAAFYLYGLFIYHVVAGR